MITRMKMTAFTTLLAIALFTLPAFAGDMGSGGFAETGNATGTRSSSLTGDMGSGGFTGDAGYLDWILGSIDEYLNWVK